MPRRTERAAGGERHRDKIDLPYIKYDNMGMVSVHFFHEHHGLLVHLEPLHLHAVVEARYHAHLAVWYTTTNGTNNRNKKHVHRVGTEE